MSKLATFVYNKLMDRAKVMAFLQDQGMVSDNAIWPEDVADADFERAKKALMQAENSFAKNH